MRGGSPWGRGKVFYVTPEIGPGLLLVLSGAAANSEMWPPPDNVFDDEAKYFVRVHVLPAGPFNISKLYFGPT